MFQINLRGIISNDIQHYKCTYLHHQIISRQIDVVLIQEWSATIRTSTLAESRRHSGTRFPLEFFPGFKVHCFSTQTAILYNEDLSVTPLPIEPQYDRTDPNQNFHVCAIIVHTAQRDLALYSVYRQKLADPSQIFEYPFHTDHIIIGGDFNIHHELWDSDHSSRKSRDFVDLLTQSKFRLLNNGNPTHNCARTDIFTCIDLSLCSQNVKCHQWDTNQAHYKQSLSDHLKIYFEIESHPSESTYHST